VDAEKKKELIAEVVTTLLVLLFYWISTTPEWKLQMYLRMVTEKLRPHRDVSHGLSQEHREILRKFRNDISEWEHKNARERE
jgi:hypothetical protein